MSRKKIIHLINGEFYAGAERVQDILALNLPEFGYDVSFACLKPRDFPRLRTAQNAPIFDLQMKSKLGFNVAIKLAELIKKNNFSIIHTHTPRSALIGRIASLLSKTPMVHHVHSPTLYDTENRLRNRVNMVAEKISMIGVNNMVAVSGSLKKYLINQGYIDNRITVIRNGVPSFEASPSNRSASKNEWVIGCVGYFRPRKGLEILLEALTELLKQGYNVKIHLVGGFETSAYQKIISNYIEQKKVGHAVVFRGACPNSDIYREFSQMDIFSLPSLYGEGLPMVILEAMAAGLPVIASAVEGVPEAITDSIEGFLVQPNDYLAVVESIKKIISDKHLHRKMCDASYRRHQIEFSDSIMASKIAQVYDRII